MADYRFSAQIIKRSKGQSSVASAAYRAAMRLVDERTGEIHDFTRKSGLVHAELLTPADTPDWMHDRAQLWNAVEIVERRGDAQLAREIQLSLPHELNPAQRKELVRDFVQEQFVAHGMIADLAIHAPGKNGDDRNHHAHIMLTMRELTGDGFGKKNRDWNDPRHLETWREEWASHQNNALERHGHEMRVDHRSFEAQGIDREPTQHLGSNAHDMEAKGKPSRIGDENRDINARNAERAELHRQSIGLDIVMDTAADREQNRFEWWAKFKKQELENAQALSSLDLDQKLNTQKNRLESELDKIYGEGKRTVQAEIAAADKRLSAKGVRKFFRDVFGRTRNDKTERGKLDLTLVTVEQREQERRDMLAERQGGVLDKEQDRQHRRQAGLDRGIGRARDRREQEGWKPFQSPSQEPQKARERESGDNDRKSREKWWKGSQKERHAQKDREQGRDNQGSENDSSDRDNGRDDDYSPE